MKFAAILVFTIALTSFQTTLAAPPSHLRGLQATQAIADTAKISDHSVRLPHVVNDKWKKIKKPAVPELPQIIDEMPKVVKDKSEMPKDFLDKPYMPEVVKDKVPKVKKPAVPELPQIVDEMPKVVKDKPEIPKVSKDKVPKIKKPTVPELPLDVDEMPKVVKDKVPKIKTPELPKLKELRHLQAKSPIESVSFADESRAASLNGVKAGEEILATVNKLEPKLYVNGDQLLKLGVQMAVSEVAALKLANEKTKKIGAALKKAIEQLFPGQKLVDVLKKLLPIIQAVVKTK